LLLTLDQLGFGAANEARQAAAEAELNVARGACGRDAATEVDARRGGGRRVGGDVSGKLHQGVVGHGAGAVDQPFAREILAQLTDALSRRAANRGGQSVG